MSEYSSIAIRNSHAEQNQLVGRIPEVRETGWGVSAHTEGFKTKLVDERKKNILTNLRIHILF